MKWMKARLALNVYYKKKKERKGKKKNADSMIQTLGESVIQPCYVTDMRLFRVVHADVAQPGMAETDYL